MAISILVGGYVLVVLILMVLTRKGQPRAPRSNPDPNDNTFNFLLFGG